MPAELKITGNSEDAIAAITKLERKLDVLENKRRFAAKAFKDEAKSFNDIIGDQTISKATSYAASWVSIGSAIGIAGAALSKFSADKDRLAQQDKVDAKLLGPIAQVANGNVLEDLKNRAAVDKAFVEGAFANRGEASTFVTSLLQNEMGDQIPLLTKAKFSTAIEDATGFGEAANTIMSAMGKAETGTYNEIYSKSIVAANVAKARGADKFLVASSEPASIASMVGVGDEELLSAMAVNSKANRSVETGATSLKNLLNQMLKNPELQGKGSLDATLSYIEEKNLKPEGLSEMLGGSVEAVQAYANLTKPDNRRLFRQTIIDVNEAAKNDLFGKTMGLPLENDPRVRQAQFAQREANINELARGQDAELRNLTDRMMSHVDTKAMERYEGFPEHFMRSFMGGMGFMDRKIWGDEAMLRRVDTSNPQAGSNPELLIDIRDTLQRIDETNRKMMELEAEKRAGNHNRNAFN